MIMPILGLGILTDIEKSESLHDEAEEVLQDIGEAS